MIISIDTENAFDKIQCPSIIKTLDKLQIEGGFLKLIKASTKLTANIIFNDNGLDVFLLRSRCLLLLLLFNIVLGFYPEQLVKRKKQKITKLGKKK